MDLVVLGLGLWLLLCLVDIGVCLTVAYLWFLLICVFWVFAWFVFLLFAFV